MMVMEKYILLIVFWSFSFLEGCVVDKLDSRLKFVNTTSSHVFIHSNFSLLNDTLIQCDNCYSNIDDWEYYHAHDTSFIPLHGKLYDEYLNQYPVEVFRVFVFASDTIKKYGWEKAKNNYMILKRYDVNLKYLKENNWIITFP